VLCAPAYIAFGNVRGFRIAPIETGETLTTGQLTTKMSRSCAPAVRRARAASTIGWRLLMVTAPVTLYAPAPVTWIRCCKWIPVIEG
jgi:hypothetical protein